MSTDPHARIAAAVRAIADAPPVTPPSPEALRARPARSVARWAAPAVAAAAVLAIAAVAALLPSRGTGTPAGKFADAPAAAALPAHFAGMSPLTADVTAAPPGPVIALYGQGSIGTRRLGTSQVLVVGTDGRTYRRLDHAEKSGWDGDDKEWHAAPSLLSPDGNRVAVGDVGNTATEFEVVDLRTGRITTYRLGSAAAAIPVSWSPDGRRVLLARTGASPHDLATGPLVLFDLDAGTSTPLGETTGWPWIAAFSPDGTRIAIPTVDGDGIEVVDTAGAVRLRLPLGTWQSLAEGPSWSPDGRLLVLSDGDGTNHRLAFLDATGTGQAVPAPLTLRGVDTPDVLGWRTPDTMLVGIDGDGDYEIAEVTVHGGPPRVVSRISHGVGHLARVIRIQLAADLVARADVRDVAGADRGPWPRWWRITLGALVLVVGLVAWRLVVRSGHIRRPLRFDRAVGHGDTGDTS